MNPPLDGTDSSGEEARPSSSDHHSIASDSSKGVGELLCTSSFARRLARGEERTKRDPKIAIQSETEYMTASSNADLSKNSNADLQVETCTTTACVTSPEGEVGDTETSPGGEVGDAEEASAKTAAAGNSESEEANEEPVAKSAAYYSGPPPQAKGNRDSKNSFNPFGEYIAFFFNKAEVGIDFTKPFCVVIYLYTNIQMKI